MILKYLDIQGFKSFPDKIRVTFGKGLTAVVGPNGSGKSNISDAVRWVLGEQSTKTLRGAKMEDVIFSGTKSRKAQGFAEVTITIDNQKRKLPYNTDEVSITRKYYRSGESEYMINKTAVRLKDINEMFMDTGLGKDGYSLVGQGKIAEIVSSKSQDRREIFEEAAGIAKLRYRKNEAQKNLVNAEDNLIRLKDILEELENRIEPLKEQSAKAKEFIQLSQDKKVLEVSIWNNTIKKSNQAIKDQSDKIIVATTQKEKVEQEIEKVEQDIQTAYEQMQECLIDIDKKRSEKTNLEQLMSEQISKIAVYKNDIIHNTQNAQRIDLELENFQNIVFNIDNEINEKIEQVNTINKDIEQAKKDIEIKQNKLENIITENTNFTKNQQELSKQLNSFLLDQTSKSMQEKQLLISVEELKDSLKDNQTQLIAKQNELEKYFEEQKSNENTMQELKQKYNALKNSFDGRKIKLDNRLSKLETLKNELQNNQLSIKEKQQKSKLLKDLEENFDGFSYSVKELIKKSKFGVIDGINGTVSQLIDVKNEYSVAIETALGFSMQNIVVENETNAKSAINFLKQNNLGRATFLPLTAIKGNKLDVYGLEKYGGFINIASNLVSFDEKYKNIIEYLLGRTVIVDDIDSAVVIARKYSYKFKIVTLDGQIINAGGSLTGGSRVKNQGFISRKNEITMLNKDIESLLKLYAFKKEDEQLLQNEVNKMQAEQQAVASEMQTINEDLIRFESEFKRVSDMANSARLAISQLQIQAEQRQNAINSYKEQAKYAKELLEKIQDNITLKTSELEKTQNFAESLINSQTDFANKISEMKIYIVEKNKDIQAINSSIEELQKRQLSSSETKSKLDENKIQYLNKNQEISKEIETTQAEISKKQLEVQEIDQIIVEIANQRQQLEASTTSMRKQEKEITTEREKLSLEIVRLEERHFAIQKEYDQIIAKLWDEYELTKSQAQEIAVEIENISKANSQLNTLKNKIRKLGSVNVAAIEEYKEVSQRYEFLNAQVKDVEKSRNELIRLIGELTKNMQHIFIENFEKINNNFKEIFVELFGGGRAELSLADPENILESGIDIFVEPPGKIIKNLSSLSGGEQAFVAIAIYFAILKVSPAPFCILDEIEAALDDVNVVKYAEYLKRMASNTQFIMITHRRGSMEAADILYGITMQEDGVSKLLQLNISDIESKNLLQGVK